MVGNGFLNSLGCYNVMGQDYTSIIWSIGFTYVIC